MIKYDETTGYLYVNGVLIGSKTSNYTQNTTQSLRIGTGNTESITPNYWYHGRLHDFRYYNRALNQTEITDIYNNQKLFGDEVLRLPFNQQDVTYRQSTTVSTTITNYANIEPVLSNITPKMQSETEWVLSTEITTDDRPNNPWSGECYDETSLPVLQPLHELSDMNGRDLEIKVEIDWKGGQAGNKSITIIPYYKFNITNSGAYRTAATITPTFVDVSSLINSSTDKFYSGIVLHVEAKWNNINVRPREFELTRLNNDQGIIIHIPSTDSDALNTWHEFDLIIPDSAYYSAASF